MSIDPNHFGVTSFAFPIGTGESGNVTVIDGELIHSPADIIRHLLVELNFAVLPSDWVGSKTDWLGSCNETPDNPDRVITTFDSAGDSFGYTQVDGNQSNSYGVQIQIRSDTFPIGWRQANSINSTLMKEVYDYNITIEENSYRIHSITAGDILPVGNESPQSRRLLFTINLTTFIARIST